MATLVKGKEISQIILNHLKTSENPSGKRVCFIYFGTNKVSKKYMDMKSDIANELGIETTVVQSKVRTTNAALMEMKSIVSKGYDGIVVQLPLRKSINTEQILNSVPISADIDLLSRSSRGLYARDKTERVPPVARAVREIISRHEIDLMGKKILVLGKGRLVGEPVGVLFDQLQIPYVSVDSNTPIDEILKNIKSADVIISGIGKPGFVTSNMVKEGVVLIDAGTSEQGGRIKGDIDSGCANVASILTPVPGGVGPITVAALFANLFSRYTV